jgi:hypothetical protein
MPEPNNQVYFRALEALERNISGKVPASAIKANVRVEADMQTENVLRRWVMLSCT